MKSTKKLLTLLTVIVMVLSFAACSKDDDLAQSETIGDDEICESCGENEAKKDGLCGECMNEEAEMCENCGENEAEKNGLCKECMNEEAEMCENCGENEVEKDGLCEECINEEPEANMCDQCGNKEADENGLCVDCKADENGYEDSIKELMYTYFQAMADGRGSDVFSCTSKSLLSDSELEEYYGKTYSEITDELDAAYADLGNVSYSMGRIFRYDAQELDELNASAPQGFSVEAAADVEFFKFNGNSTSGLGTRTVGLYDGQWYIMNF